MLYTYIYIYTRLELLKKKKNTIITKRTVYIPVRINAMYLFASEFNGNSSHASVSKNGTQFD